MKNEKSHTIRIVPKLIETEGKSILTNTHIHDRTFSWLPGVPNTHIHDRTFSWPPGVPNTHIHDRTLSWLPDVPNTHIHDAHSPDYLVSLTPIYMTAHSPDHLVTIMEIVKAIRIVLCFLTKIIIVVGHIDYTGNYFES